MAWNSQAKEVIQNGYETWQSSLLEVLVHFFPLTVQKPHKLCEKLTNGKVAVT